MGQSEQKVKKFNCKKRMYFHHKYISDAYIKRRETTARPVNTNKKL